MCSSEMFSPSSKSILEHGAPGPRVQRCTFRAVDSKVFPDNGQSLTGTEKQAAARKLLERLVYSSLTSVWPMYLAAEILVPVRRVLEWAC